MNVAATLLQQVERRGSAAALVGDDKYPRRIAFADELPKGPTGKILKRAIDLEAVRVS